MIIVLKEGEVVEKGTHEELLREKGLYYSMWQQQASLEAGVPLEEVDDVDVEVDEAIKLVAEEQAKAGSAGATQKNGAGVSGEKK